MSKERLVYLLRKTMDEQYEKRQLITPQHTADHLLANGVIVPPCKVGDKYYSIEKFCNVDPDETEREKVAPWDCEKWCRRNDCSFMEKRVVENEWFSVPQILQNEQYIGKYVFLTREEAEAKLEEGESE